MDDEDNSDDPTPEEEAAWFAEGRREVLDYLRGQRVTHGAVSKIPAWAMTPYFSLWPVESLKAPGFVGWWVIWGDLPTDYCSAEQPAHPRTAMRQFSDFWMEVVRGYRPGDKMLGDSFLPAHLRDDLLSRAEFMANLVETDDVWEPWTFSRLDA